MHVLVTGGAGFIGAHSVRELLARGHRVSVIDDLSRGKREAVPEGAALHVLDLRSEALPALVGTLRPDAVLHLAAQMDVRRSMAEPLFDASVNVLGTVNLLAAAQGVKRFVFSSTGGAIYGEQEHFPAGEDHPRRPASAYGVSKLCAEEYLAFHARSLGLSALSLRYANVYGPGQDPHGEAGVVAIFLDRLLSGAAAVIHGDGSQTRDYVHVQDVARANLLALEGEAPGALNIGTGVETSVLALSRKLAEITGRGRAFAHGPAKAGEQRRSAIDPAAAAVQLGWKPRIALDDGLRQTAEWFIAARNRG